MCYYTESRHSEGIVKNEGIVKLGYRSQTYLVMLRNTLIPINLSDQKFERTPRPNFLSTKLLACGL